MFVKLVRGGRFGGWVAWSLDQLEMRLNSASVKVEVEAGLGNNLRITKAQILS